MNNIPTPYRKTLFDKIDDLLVDTNHSFEVFYLSKTESVRNWTDYNFTNYESVFKVLFQSRNKTTTTSDYIFNYGYLSKVLSHDVMVFFGYNYPTYIFSSLFRKVIGKDNILFCESTSIESSKSKFAQLVKKFIISLFFDRYVVPGFESFKYLVSMGIKEDLISIVNNSSDLKPSMEYLSLSPSQNLSRLLYVGRLSDEKNVIPMIEQLQSSDMHFEMKIVGSGPLSKKVQNLINNDERFKLYAHMSQDELKVIYSNSDVLLLPSNKETWGLVVNEAINFGLAVLVSSSVGCRHELVKGNGDIFETDNYDDMLCKLKNILSNVEYYKENSLALSTEVTVEKQAEGFLNCCMGH